MKIKWNWGTGILIVILIFIGSVFFRVYLSYQRNVDIISSDYYPKGINFQTEIEKRNNTTALREKPIIHQTNDSVVIIFPISLLNNSSSGNLYFYCPSDIKYDFSIDLKPDGDTIQSIHKKHLKLGKYIVKFDWQTNNLKYYYETQLIVN